MRDGELVSLFWGMVYERKCGQLLRHPVFIILRVLSFAKCYGPPLHNVNDFGEGIEGGNFSPSCVGSLVIFIACETKS